MIVEKPCKEILAVLRPAVSCRIGRQQRDAIHDRMNDQPQGGEKQYENVRLVHGLFERPLDDDRERETQ